MNNYLYGVRDLDTGKLVSDITNPRRKYWDREGNARQAICHALNPYSHSRHKRMALVKFELVPVEEQEIGGTNNDCSDSRTVFYLDD